MSEQFELSVPCTDSFRRPIGKEPDQVTDTILMVRPDNFGFNEEAARTNVHMDAESIRGFTKEELKELAIAEFEGFRKVLEANGVNVVVMMGTDLETPDEVWPNNWVSTHIEIGSTGESIGTLIIYPMRNDTRRNERRPQEMIDLLRDSVGARVDRVLDLSELEDVRDKDMPTSELEDGIETLVLEGTGSLVLDRRNKLAFAALSPRTKKGALEKFAREAGYEVIAFDTVDPNPKNVSGGPTYHTNVVMSLGEDFAVICSRVIQDSSQRTNVLDRIKGTGREIIELDEDQMLNFSANCLQVKGTDGKTLLVMSTRAKGSLKEDQVERIENYAKIVHAPLTWLEIAGGGSARCTMAEIHLPATTDKEVSDI